jgi:PAS domain S-box-containing protein
MNSAESAAITDLMSSLAGPGSGPLAEILRTLLDAMPYGLLLCDTNRRVLLANSTATAFLRATGEPEIESPEQLSGRLHLIDPRTERTLPDERTPLSRALRGESTDFLEYMLRTAHGGGRIWIECSCRPLRPAAGAITGALFTFRVITERKKKELAYQSADQMLHFVYHENLAGIVHTTFDGRIIDCNEAILRTWGYESKAELLAIREPQLYYDPGERDRMLRLLSGPRRLSEFEVCFRRKDGSRCWCLLNVRLFDAATGEVGGSIVSAVIDITDRKQHEEELRQSEARFSAFMSHLPGVAFIKDLSGKYVYYNEASQTLFQMRPEDMVGKTDEQIWPPEFAGRYRQNDASVVQSKRPAEFVEQIEHPDGIHSWLIVKFPIIESGKVVLVCSIGIDITERRILEEQLTQARKMEALGRLAGGVAHDFNNLLTVISGYGQLTLEGIDDTPGNRLVPYLQEILNSSRRAAGLTGQLLAFSRRQLVEPRLLDLAELLRNMERLLQRVIGEHVDLTVRCGREPCLIRADAHQMEQVVMNLAANARDAMPLGGELDLSCERLAQPVEGPQNTPLEILLMVRDTGIGMDVNIKAKIFDPFFTSKEKGKGTGLGLSMVYGLVSQVNGKIEVESEQGEGTVFRIYFPAASGEIDVAGDSKVSATLDGGEIVLLVEDEASVRALAETILKRMGYDVLVADCGATAINIWKEKSGRVDVLLTDVIMPQMSGGELATRLREINPRLKVLFMSGYTDDMIASHGVLAGETQLLQKPFTAEGLGRKLRDVLNA